MAARWAEIEEQAKRRWRQIPDSCFEELEHRRGLFVSLLQIFHGMTRQEAEHEIDQLSAATDRPAAPPSPARSWWPWRRRA